MKKVFKKVLAIALSLAVVITFIPMTTVTASAASKATPKTITVTADTNVLSVGEKTTLSAKVSPSKASQLVTWKTSNKNVATVSSKGVVTAKKAGTVTITAVSKSKSSVKKTYKMTVCTTAKSVKITGESHLMDVGGKMTLKAAVSPSKTDQQVIWSSSDKSVATVTTKGVVTGKSAGTVTITAKAKSKKSVKKTYKIYVCPVDEEQLATLRSARLVDGTETLYEVNYTADYKLDEVISGAVQKSIQTSGNISNELLKVLIPDSSYIVETTASDEVTQQPGGCSSFTYQLDNGHYVLGRNYDWSTGSPIAEVIHTDPEDGYASVGLADLSWVKVFKEAGYADMDEDGYKETEVYSYYTEKCKELTLLAPYYTVDGINEKGFSCAVLILDENSTQQGDTSSDNILIQSHVVRTLLDKCATVDEAIELLSSKDIQSPIRYYDEEGGGSDFHWSMMDESGDACIVEYVDSKMYVSTTDGVYEVDSNGNREKVEDGVLEVEGVFNVEGYNNYYYLDFATKTYGAVIANKKGEDVSRDDEDFLAVTNFYISAFNNSDEDLGEIGEVLEGATTFVGEGVSRYKDIYEELESGDVKTSSDAMNVLKKARYGYNDGDCFDNAEFLTDAFAEGGYYRSEQFPAYAAYWQEAADAAENAEDKAACESYVEYYETAADIYGAPYTGNLYSQDIWLWETYWSNVYDVTSKTLNLAYHQNYDDIYRFGITYKK